MACRRSLVLQTHALLEGDEVPAHGRERLGGHVPLDQLPPRPPRGVEHVLSLALFEKMPQHPPVRAEEGAGELAAQVLARGAHVNEQRVEVVQLVEAAAGDEDEPAPLHEANVSPSVSGGSPPSMHPLKARPP